MTDLCGSSVGWILTVLAGKLKSEMKELTGAQVSLASEVVASSSNETVTRPWHQNNQWKNCYLVSD